MADQSTEIRVGDHLWQDLSQSAGRDMLKGVTQVFTDPRPLAVGLCPMFSRRQGSLARVTRAAESHRVVEVLCPSVRANDLKDGPFHTAVFEVLDTNRTLATASPFVDPNSSGFAGLVDPSCDQIAQGLGEHPAGLVVQSGWCQTIRSGGLSPRCTMLDRLFDVSGMQPGGLLSACRLP